MKKIMQGCLVFCLLAACSSGETEILPKAGKADLRACLISEAKAQVETASFDTTILGELAEQISRVCLEKLMLEKSPLAGESFSMAESLLAGTAAAAGMALSDR